MPLLKQCKQYKQFILFSTVLSPSLIKFLDLVGIGGEVGMAELEDLDDHYQGDYIPGNGQWHHNINIDVFS